MRSAVIVATMHTNAGLGGARAYHVVEQINPACTPVGPVWLHAGAPWSSMRRSLTLVPRSLSRSPSCVGRPASVALSALRLRRHQERRLLSARAPAVAAVGDSHGTSVPPGTAAPEVPEDGSLLETFERINIVLCSPQGKCRTVHCVSPHHSTLMGLP